MPQKSCCSRWGTRRWHFIFLLALCVGAAQLGFGQVAPKQPRLPNVDKRLGPAERRAAHEPPPGRAVALSRLREEVPDVQVDFDHITGAPKYIRSLSRGLTPVGAPKAGAPANAQVEGNGNGNGNAKATANGNGNAANRDASGVTRAFVDRHRELFGHGAAVFDSARVRRDFVAAHSGMRSTVWEQELDGVPIHEAVLIAHTAADGELVSIASQFVADPAGAADENAARRAGLVAAPPISLEQAVVRAARDIGDVVNEADVRRVPAPVAAAGAAPKIPRRIRLSAGRLPGDIHGNLTWLPVSPHRLRLCWEIILSGRTHREMFSVLVDARSGEVWLRNSLTAYATPASYRVFTSDSPSPFSPGHPMPQTNQPPTATRALVVTTAANTNASPAGWIPDGTSETRGNNVDAHTDADDDDAPDLPRPDGGPGRVFDFPLDLDQAPSTYAAASVVQLFYWCNWMHDQLYDLGFTESAGNFQVTNFDRGGEDDDPVLADAQDGGGFNNANMGTPPDGLSPRMQMYLFNGPNPDRDGGLDAEVILHEYTHGLSTRRVGGGNGLNRQQSAGMGEGWSDFYALTLLSEASDDPDGVYAAGGYATYQLAGLMENYYFGIRRYPYSTDLRKNPLTFQDIDPTQATAHEDVRRSPIDGPFTPNGAGEVHNQGEVWCSLLWEVRANLIRKLGFTNGNRLTLQLVTDGMNLAPANPNFVQARDAILMADRVGHRGTNVNELWRAFAKRGLGASALSPASSTTTGIREAFDPLDPLRVQPSIDWLVKRTNGASFGATVRVYTLTNPGPDTIRWTVHNSAAWLRVSATSGTLLPRAPAQQVVVSLENSALALTEGTHVEKIMFSNSVTHVSQPRYIAAQVGQPDFLTELFEDYDFDLAFQTLTFTPDTSLARYSVCRVPAVRFPTDPANGVTVTLNDDAFAKVTLNDGADVSLFNQRTNVFFIGSNGYLTLNSGDTFSYAYEYFHFLQPRISGFFADLDPSRGGRISWKQMSNLVAVTYENVADAYNSATNSFQIEWFFDGRIRVTYLRIGTTYGLVGLSDGLGLPDAYEESDFSAYPDCRQPSLHLTVPPVIAEGAGELDAAVSLDTAMATNVVVTLVSTDPAELSVPSTIIIPAGQTTVPLVIEVGDDLKLDGAQPVLVSASAPGFRATHILVEVTENETTSLRLVLPDPVMEGSRWTTGRVEVARAPDASVVVHLHSSHTNELIVPESVLIAAGATSAVFNAQIVDDSRLDGPQRVTINADVANWTGATANVTVLDNESTNLVVKLPPKVREGQNRLHDAGRVIIAGTLSSDLRVSLASSDPGELEVAPEVTIPSGQVEAAFDLVVVDDPAVDGARAVQVSAAATNLGMGKETVTVLDNETPLAPFFPSPANLASNVAVTANLSWVGGEFDELIVNGGFEEGTFRGWTRVASVGNGFEISTATNRPPIGDSPTVPFEGEFNAASRQFASGVHELYQAVNLPGGPVSERGLMLRWVDRVRNASTSSSANQEYRVEIRSTNDQVLAVASRAQLGALVLSDWTTREFDLSSYAGQTVRIAFVVNPGQSYLEVDVDNVSVAWRNSSRSTEFEVFFGRNPAFSPADRLGVTTVAAWDLPDLQPATTYYWQVNARTLGQTQGPIWRFTTAGLDHFDWDPISSPQRTGQSFAVGLSARDARGTIVSNFNGRVALSAISGVSSRSLFADDFEDGDITDWNRDSQEGTWTVGSAAAVGSRGLSLLGGRRTYFNGISHALPNLTPDVVSFYVRTSRADGNGGYVVLGNGPSTSFNAVLFRMGPDGMGLDEDTTQGYRIPYRPGQWYHVELVFAWTNQTVDYYVDGVLQRPNIPFRRAMTGLSRIYLFNFDYMGGGWDQIEFKGTNQAVTVAMTPGQTGEFTDGRWTGEVNVAQTGRSIVFRADDGHGHTGVSQPLDLVSDNKLLVWISQEPEEASLASPITYAVHVFNPGPQSANGVMVTNRVPAGSTLGTFQSSTGQCTSALGEVVCNVGTLAAGATMELTVTVTATTYGRLTNAVNVAESLEEGGGNGPTEFYEAAIVTMVVPPRLTVSDVTVVEGNIGITEAVFQLTLSASNALPVTVRFATTNITAVAGSDYVSTEGLLVFPPGTTRQNVVVPVLGDASREGTEVFRFRVLYAQNATVESGEALGIIIDDDPAAVATLPFREDWESGLRGYWLPSGLGPYRSSISRSNQPHGGTFHLVMDNVQDNGASARSELTLNIDLGGATNVVLRFWAEGSFYDPADGPPSPGFVGSASFDGVAVSMDGFHWYEVQGLRSIPSSYTEYVVALDEKIHSLGLAFTQNFRIRFNRVSPYQFPFSGMAIDDITITGDRPTVQPVRFNVTAEDCVNPNQAVDPGETVTAEFWLTNSGAVPLHQLTATLLSAGNVMPLSGSQGYGELLPGGPAVARAFSFKATGLCGDTLVPTLQLALAGVPFARVQFESTLGHTNLNLWTMAAPSGISILSNGPALPFPSTITIPGTGRVEKVVVRLEDFSHPLPDQVDILLRSPSGRTVTLLSDTGGLWPVENVDLVFDGASTNRLRDNDPLLPGVYNPTNHGSADAYPPPAPAPPYGVSLDEFNGTEVHGPWELYVLDDTLRDGGSIGGWSLEIQVRDVSCCGDAPVADLDLALQASPAAVALDGTVNFTSTIKNHGPNGVSDLVLSNTLPRGAVFLSATSSVGSCSMEADQLRCVLGALAGNDTATVNVSVWARQSGFLTNSVVLYSAIRDATPTNNAAQAVVYVAAPTLSAANASAPEAAGQVVRFTVNLTPLSARTSLVQFATADISAVAGVDYQPTNGVLMFFPGETSKTISVRIMDDVADEANEDFALTFYNPINVNINTPRVVGTIVDNDNPPSLTIADANVTEGNSGLTPLQFRLQLSAISGQFVEVDFATANGSAVAPSDYVATNGTVTFVPGEITRLLPVFVQGERLNEMTESFSVSLSFPFNATISDGTAVGTILNDDFLPTFSVANDLIAVESCATNRAIDPGETVTLSFTFRNIATGGARATNLVATLQPTGGVLAPSPGVVLGAVVPGGIVTNRFTFTADALCGETVVATFLLEDNQVGLGSVSVPLRVGQPVISLAENFDGVPAPALPAGWTTAAMGATTPWHTTASVRDTLPNAVMTSNPSIRTTNDLISPPVSIATLNARLTFRHSFDTEETFDGGILEISVENGPFTEWLTAGGEFEEGAYNGDIDFFEPGWTGTSRGFQTVIATLPPTAVEHTVRFRWRFTSDSSVGGVGWFVDSISMVDGYLCCEPIPFLLSDISTDGTAVTLRWDSMPNRLYRIQYKPSLNATEWIDLPGDVQAAGATSTWIDRSPPTGQRFYRVMQLP